MQTDKTGKEEFNMPDMDYFNYAIVLFIVTGLLIIRFDTKSYRMAEMKKEKKFATFLGWVNVSIGIVLFILWWVYRTWLWWI